MEVWQWAITAATAVAVAVVGVLTYRRRHRTDARVVWYTGVRDVGEGRLELHLTPVGADLHRVTVMPSELGRPQTWPPYVLPTVADGQEIAIDVGSAHPERLWVYVTFLDPAHQKRIVHQWHPVTTTGEVADEYRRQTSARGRLRRTRIGPFPGGAAQVRLTPRESHVVEDAVRSQLHSSPSSGSSSSGSGT